MWKKGFSIDDGNLRLYDDPSSKEFLNSISRGWVPFTVLCMNTEFVVTKGGSGLLEVLILPLHWSDRHFLIFPLVGQKIPALTIGQARNSQSYS